MKKLLIIGGGTAGTMLANKLAKGLTKEVEKRAVEITVISDKDYHVYQPGFLYIPFQLKRPEEIVRPIQEVMDPKVKIIFGTATEIKEKEKAVTLKSGKSLSYDYLIVATGSHPQPVEIPGLEEVGHMFFTMDSALKLQEAMKNFKGGRVVVAVSLPHKCPVAPLEFVMMFEDWTRKQGIRNETEITYAYPLAGPYGTASVAELATKEFEERNINIETFFFMDSVDTKNKELLSLDGRRLPFDLLVAIPPHKGAEVIKDSGFGDGDNWLPTDRHQLNLENQDSIFVIGDATNLPISKAGSTAHFESEILADNLIDKIRGGEGNKKYNGKVFCFIETGLDKATYISFDYENPPKPVTPSKMVHYGKVGYNNMHWVNLKGIM